MQISKQYFFSCESRIFAEMNREKGRAKHIHVVTLTKKNSTNQMNYGNFNKLYHVNFENILIGN